MSCLLSSLWGRRSGKATIWRVAAEDHIRGLFRLEDCWKKQKSGEIALNGWNHWFTSLNTESDSSLSLNASTDNSIQHVESAKRLLMGANYSQQSRTRCRNWCAIKALVFIFSHHQLSTCRASSFTILPNQEMHFHWCILRYLAHNRRLISLSTTHTNKHWSVWAVQLALKCYTTEQ